MLNKDSQWAVRLPRTCPSLPPPRADDLLFKAQISRKSSLTILLSKALHSPPPPPPALTHFPLSH